MGYSFASHSVGVSDPFTNAVDIDPLKSDTVDLPNAVRSLYVTVAGAVKFTTIGGTTDTWTVPANFIIPMVISRVWSTGTTATGIKGGF
jgi:hypothetical protein